MDDREKLKAEIREEILAELQAKSRKTVAGLDIVRKKWFYGPDKNYKYSGSKMYQLFGNDQHKVWDSVRVLTRVIFRKNYCSQLDSVDQKEVERIADAICNMVFEFGDEASKEDAQ